MDKDLLHNLCQLSEEEINIKSGDMNINKKIYMSRTNTNIIDSKKLMENGKLITVRPHTRFIYFPKHTHNYIELVYMCQGETIHIVNGDKIVLSKGQLLLIGQNTTHEIFEAKENDICINFIILPEFFDTTLTMLGEDGNLLRDFLVSCLKNDNNLATYMYFQVEEILPIQNLVENLIWTITNKQQNKRNINKITMGLLMLQLLNHTDRLTIGRDNVEKEILFRVYEFIEENYKNGELSKLSDKLGYDLPWLSRTIKNLTGQTYTELMQAKRLNQAVFLLKNTRLPISDIAYMVGYSNLSYFYRIFRNKFGLSPRAYRMSIK